MHILNLVLADSDIFRTLVYLGTKCSCMFMHVYEVTLLMKVITEYLPIFGHISVDSGIFRIPALPVQIV